LEVVAKGIYLQIFTLDHLYVLDYSVDYFHKNSERIISVMI